MLKKTLSIVFVIIMFLVTLVFCVPHDKTLSVVNVNSPNDIELEDNKNLKIQEFECFDNRYTIRNAELAKMLGITEEEAFILGNTATQWSENLLKTRRVVLKSDDLFYLRKSYKAMLKYSGFCLKDSKPSNQMSFDLRLNDIRKGKFRVLDLDTENVYKPNDIRVRELDNFLVLKTYSIPFKTNFNKKLESVKKYKTVFQNGEIKIIFTDLTTKLKPDRKCDTLICKEILNNINNAQKTIDIAIYGYSTIPDIENAIKNAISRGVKVRLVYDLDANGKNIYPNTFNFINLLKDSTSDKLSSEAASIMHNKFYIFDDKILITGSANLSHTDMSGYNTNSIVVINSPLMAQVYKQEFEQMYGGKFHNEKESFGFEKIDLSGVKLQVCFSPQDKGIEKLILPLINNAKDYIYIPTFVLTERRVASALINAKRRGVEIKIIMDALNSSTKHSKINELRSAGLQVKTENYAGKMHSKSMVVDDKYTIIGSMNFSYSGENKNDENFLVIENNNIAKMYKEFFEYQWSKIDDKWLKYSVRAESVDSIGSCSDGLDNNYDGLIDLNDPNCKK